jgi:hypothetical protein
MHRLRFAVFTAFVAGVISGCGEDQPNAAAQPNEVNADFAKKSVDMMKSANAGMDPKAARKGLGAPPKK